MKKLCKFSIPTILLFFGCFKPNSTVPITAIQQKMNGNWQVDSTLTISYNTYWTTDPITGYYQPHRMASDSIYKNHLVEISSNGNTVTINMKDSHVMKYTISGYSLSPYVQNSALPSFSAGGCGMPFVQNNTVEVTDHHLVISSYELNGGAGIDTSITYMHR